jgi:trehalose synthase
VAEILRSEIPLLRDLGISADWQLVRGNETFFRVTKTIHNGLQGAAVGLSADDEERYLVQSERNARALEGQYDVVVVHDPQPLALLDLHGARGSRWIWRCHVDSSQPNPSVWEFLRPFLVPYDAAVFTMDGFVPPDFPVARTVIIPPAIDPESPKNLPLSGRLARRVVEWIGVETTRPLIAQISRFDEWKDPLGVVAAYRLVREQVPDVQLALVGSMALDDPEGWRVYRRICREVEADPDIHVFTNLTGVGNVEVNAFQRLTDVVVQKSIREGFGLVVSEALWKGTPVVAGRAGGIPMQLEDGRSGHLVDSVEECACRVVELLGDPDRRRAFGEHGQAHVRAHFLLPRLLADELRLYASVLGVPHAT